MNKFRLAVFNTQPPHFYFGGVERRIIETTRRLQNEADITVYSGTKAGFKQSLLLDGVDLVPYYSTDRLFPLDNWFFNRSIAKNASTIQADVYEAHAVSGYGLLRALNKQEVKKPFIHTIHGVLADEYEQAKLNGYQSFRSRIANSFMHRLANLEGETANKATLIVTISNYSFAKINQYYSIELNKVRIVPNGVDTEKFKPSQDQEAIKRRFGLSDKPCALFVGNLIPRKGLQFLVEAAKEITKTISEFQFLIVGDGPQKNQLQNIIKTANLSSNFKFYGKVMEETLPTMYNCADVFVLPSIQEGQGIVLLEAQASGKPAVAFDIGGVNEAVRNGETGLLVKRASIEELADALLRIVSDKNLSEKMGANARKFVLDNFTWDLCAQNMLRVYNEVLGR